jgi:CRISPR-associated exonuclease Cas4
LVEETKKPIRCIQGEKLVPNDFNVQHEFEYLLEKENKRAWSRKTGVFHPSAITRCARALYYDRINLPPKPCIPKETRMLFDMGHAIHDAIQSKLSLVPGFEAEVEASYKPLDLFGHCDGVFYEEDWVLEIKTAGDSVFKSLVKPRAEHITQVHCYMWCLDIPRAQIMYVHRSTGRLRVFPITFVPEIWEQVVKTIFYINDCVSSETPPPKEVNSFTCRTCKFKYECNPFNE